MAESKGTILVTGANGGLGSAIAEQIASRAELSSYHGLYTVRNAKSAPGLAAALEPYNATHRYDTLSLDLTKLDNVREVAKEINNRVSEGELLPIRALILNAGYQELAIQTWTDDGFDQTFAANYLGQWLLTVLLLVSMDKENGRIIMISSQTHDPDDSRNAGIGTYDEDKDKIFVRDEADIEGIAKGTKFSIEEDPSWRSGFRRYGAAKSFLIMMVHELQRRLAKDPPLKGIRVLGVDPGTMVTTISRRSSWIIRVFMFQIVYPLILYFFPNHKTVRSTRRSASDVIEATFGVSVASDNQSDPVYFNGREPVESSAESRDIEKAALVWSETAKYAHLKGDETVLKNWQ